MKLNKTLILISSILCVFLHPCMGCEKIEYRDINGHVFACRLKKEQKLNDFYFIDSTGIKIKVCAKPDAKAIIPELLMQQYISSHLEREETFDFQGFILLAVYIDENDRIVEYRVIPSYTSQICEKCVIQALNLMKGITVCKSAVLNGEKVKSIVYVSIPFR